MGLSLRDAVLTGAKLTSLKVTGISGSAASYNFFFFNHRKQMFRGVAQLPAWLFQNKTGVLPNLAMAHCIEYKCSVCT